MMQILIGKRNNMSIENKIKTAKPSTWLTDGIPSWKVTLIVYFARIKGKILFAIKDKT